MPWFKVHSGWTTHEKVLTLCALLRDDRADVYVARLWDYCAVKRGDGKFTGPAAAGMLERAVRFQGEAGALADAMVSSGLLERHDDGTLEVHDWAAEQSALAAKFERDRARPHSSRRPARGFEDSRTGSARGPHGVRTVPAQTPPGESREKRVEKKQSPTETADRAGAQPALASVEPTLLGLELPPAEPKPPRPDSPAAAWAKRAAEARRAVIPATAVQETKFNRSQWARLGEALKTHGTLTLDAALTLYLAADGYPREQDYALGLFIAQVDEWVTKAHGAAARARAGPGSDKPRLDPRPVTHSMPAVAGDKPRL
ncbi:hypothetical protein [Corallococcus silvisoli]|uniref:hypothetical protein n=1 Tax=Corallococcus silvisoli TaxID=2697031 RepID=UPI001378E177|nr:hypothetical protein [Corallococcus silvisoli]NBD11810.1 hypothetical protein [Corallococcus silvisoli]